MTIYVPWAVVPVLLLCLAALVVWAYNGLRCAFIHAGATTTPKETRGG